MRRAMLSILTLYNQNESIFDNFEIPNGLDKENICQNLLMELGELEILYPNPSFMKFAIGTWSKKELPVWNKLYETLNIEYNPIWNQFRTEEITDSQVRDLSGTNNETRDLNVTDNETRDLLGSDNETRNLSGTNNETRNLTGSDTEVRDLDSTNNETRDLTGTSHKESNTDGTTNNTGSDITQEEVNAFNESFATPAKKTTTTLGSGNVVTGEVITDDNTTDSGTVNRTTSDNGTVEHETTDSGTVNKTLSDTGTINRAKTENGTVNRDMTDNGTVNRNSTDIGTVENTHKATYEGHTGIVTVQKLIEEQREVVQFNLSNFIINSFKNRFCIEVW